MRRLAFGLLVVILSAASPCVQSAHAYYDDVHFAYTYYMARQSGFTPLQAFRIASACADVDIDDETEPVQKSGQKRLTFTPFEGAAQDPRWKFHAMRKELKYRSLHFGDVVGNGVDGPAADGEIREQREVLWQQALTETKNPGVFLHFFQDEVPHHAYGAAWGHWPMLPGCTADYAKHKLPIGGTTDWVSYRPDDVRLLAERCSPYFQKFIDTVSPHQYWRPYYEQEYTQLVADLAKSKYPASIDTEFKREFYIEHFARASDIPNIDWANLVDPSDLQSLASDLKLGLSVEDYSKHEHGPSLKDALVAVDKALKAAGMTDTIPSGPYKYDLDDDGSLDDSTQIDQWVLVGSLEITVKSKAPVKASLRMPVRDREGKAREMDLPGLQPITIEPGASYLWKDLPVGDLVLVLVKEDGKEVRNEVTLDKQVNTLPLITLDEDVAPAAGDLKLEMVFADSSGMQPTIRAVNPPEDAGQLRAAIEKYQKAVDDKWVLVTMTGAGLTRYRWQKMMYLGAGSSMLSLVDASFDLPRGKHKVTATMSLLGQPLSATGEFNGIEGTPVETLRKRLADQQAAHKEVQAKTEKGREECRRNIRLREEELAEVAKSLNDKDLAPESRANLEKRMAVLKQEIADWNATLALLDPRPGEPPPWIETLKFWEFEAWKGFAFCYADLGSYEDAKKSLDEAARWGLKETSVLGDRLAIATRYFDLKTCEETAVKLKREPDYLFMARISLHHRNDLNAARTYVSKWQKFNKTDQDPGLDMPPENAEFAK